MPTLYRSRRDKNHAEIRDALREFGASVADTASLGDGFPDLVVGWNGVNYLLEVKSGNGKLTPLEQQFAEDWRGQVITVRTVEESIALVIYRDT